MHKQMPKINHRLVSVFLFLKKSQISACFYSPILPKIIGGLLMVACGQFGIARATVYDGPNVFFGPYLPFNEDSECTNGSSGGNSGVVDWLPTIKCNGIEVQGIGVMGLPTSGSSTSFGTVQDTIEYNSDGSGVCWCKMLVPVVTKWVSIRITTVSTCAGLCAYNFMENTNGLRGILLDNIISE